MNYIYCEYLDRYLPLPSGYWRKLKVGEQVAVDDKYWSVNGQWNDCKFIVPFAVEENTFCVIRPLPANQVTIE